MGRTTERCGYMGCSHMVSRRKGCGDRLCPRNAEASGTPLPGRSPMPPSTINQDPFATTAVRTRVTDLALLDPMTPLREIEFAVIDVETNHFTPDGNGERLGEIVQLGVVIATTERIIDRWATNIRPLSGDPGPTDVHGLTAEDLRAAPTFAEAHHELLDRFDGRPIVGHNLVRFDAWWVRSELRRIGYATRKGVVGIDTIDLARGAPVDYDSNRLGPLCHHYGVPLEGWHRADVDAEATAGLLPHLFAAHSMQVIGDLTSRYKKARGPVSWLESTGSSPAD